MKWPNVEMRRVADVASGFGFPRNYQGETEEEYPFFKVGDMNSPGNEQKMINVTNSISAATLKKLKAKTFPAGTVIFPKIGAAIATNKKRMLVKPSVVDNNVMGLIPNKQINEWYLYYWMQQFDLRSVSNIGPVPSMRKTTVEQILVPLPSPSEQRQIVKILEQADRLCKLRAEADKKAERILPAMFLKMFGDPATNPMGWKTGVLGDVILETQYGTSTRANTDGKGVPVIRMNNIDLAGNLDLSNIKHIELSEKEQKKYLLAKGDILFNRTNSKELVGKTGIWPGHIHAVLASYLIRVRTDPNQVAPEFVWAFMNLPFTKQVLLNISRRAIGMANVNAQELRNFPFFIPNIELQKSFSTRLQIVNDLKSHREHGNEKLNDLFAVLLYRAFTGDLTATWRQAHMKELLQEMELQAKALTS